MDAVLRLFDIYLPSKSIIPFIWGDKALSQINKFWNKSTSFDPVNSFNLVVKTRDVYVYIRVFILYALLCLAQINSLNPIKHAFSSIIIKIFT